MVTRAQEIQSGIEYRLQWIAQLKHLTEPEWPSKIPEGLKGLLAPWTPHSEARSKIATLNKELEGLAWWVAKVTRLKPSLKA